MRLAAMTATLYAFWLLLSGMFTPFLLAAGAGASLAVALLARRMEIADREGHPLHLAAAALTYWPWLVKEIVKSGKLGKVHLIRANYDRNSESGAWIYPIPPDADPKTVNWDMFVGPAPKRPFSLERFFRWRCYWDYSGGISTDLFVHLMTTIHYVMDATVPESVIAYGANYRHQKTHEVLDVDGARIAFGEGAWGLCRASNTGPVLVLRFEARDAARRDAIRSEVEGVVAEVRRGLEA